MNLQVVTPEGSKIESEAQEVTAPGVVGYLGIMPGHRALLTSLDIGLLSYLTDGKTRWLAVNGGYLEVADDQVIVVTETAETPADVDVERARRALERAEGRLKEIGAARSESQAVAMARKRRAENRIAVAKHRRPSIPS